MTKLFSIYLHIKIPLYENMAHPAAGMSFAQVNFRNSAPDDILRVICIKPVNFLKT